MKTQLDLTFVPIVSDLMHIPSLKSQFIGKAVPDCTVDTVAIKVLDLFIVTDVPLSVYKNFVVKCVVIGPFDQLFSVQSDIDHQVISEACTKVLIFYPALFKPESMVDIGSAAQLLR